MNEEECGDVGGAVGVERRGQYRILYEYIWFFISFLNIQGLMALQQSSEVQFASVQPVDCIKPALNQQWAEM